jgi:GTP pyrophosphokinase
VDRLGLLREISDAFSKHKINIISVKTHVKQGEARMSLLVRVSTVAELNIALTSVREIKGIIQIIRC